MPAVPGEENEPLRQRLRAAVPHAMKSGDRVALAALRGALAALDNAEAVDPPAASPAAGAIERSPIGVGAAELPRRALSPDDVDRLVRAEIAEREAAAREYDRCGRPDRAQRLRAEAAVLSAHLTGP